MKAQTAQCLTLLQEIATDYPDRDILTHLSLILNEYRTIPALPDKEFLFLIRKYKTELELDLASHSPYTDFTEDWEEDDLAEEDDDF